ncbi:hypothetical protein AJ80_02831 [Polytolypa hystricis UAMH7299]|uniref:M protein repeat protein n=1 Tax=Polytolypa hystricis (strain UAMH7299) TaxID=1447883 RepID=A0A2B7YQ97_POLH7|nr:hypothetical protein AJ80_02831 [Polytolypa hystricis UAMH7299]
MADADEKTKAEKLAAAKKRVAQLQKQKAKKAGKKDKAAAAVTAAAGETSKESTSTAAEAETVSAGDEQQAPAPELDEDAPSTPVVAEQEDAEGKQKDEAPEEQDADEEEESGQPGNEWLEQQQQIPTRGAHGRQPSLSLQSKIRSSSFRRTAADTQQQPSFPSSSIKSPPLPPLSPDGDAVPEVFRKQALRLEELEKETKRLERELEDVEARRKKSEEALEDFRDASGDVVELKERLERAERKGEEVEKLKAEITALQRQNSHLHTRSHRSSNSVALSGGDSSPATLLAQLDSKSATIEAMALEISNLKAELNSKSSTTEAHEEQIHALEDKVTRTETALEKSQRELTDTKHSLSRAAEKAMKEGVDKTSTETLIKSLERQVQETNAAKAEADKKIETLEKKLQALGNLHKESENRNQTRQKERDKFEKDAAMLKKKLVTIENENLRLREERDRLRKRDAGDAGNEDGLDELEDEERQRLEKRVRELEGEVFDLRRGIWKEKKRELTEGYAGEGHDDAEELSSASAHAAAFDDVDLVGGLPSGSGHSRRRSISRPQQKHSSFATVLSSGLAAFTNTGAPDGRSRAGSTQSRGHTSTAAQGRGSLELLSEKDGGDGGFLDDDDDAFDEEAFAFAQAEEEARKRVEWVREVKKKLKDWEGWRLDLVDCRYGVQGVGVGMGEIFEV